jgi:hypothetical protein
MNVEIGTEAAQFPEKEYIIGSFLAVHDNVTVILLLGIFPSSLLHCREENISRTKSEKGNMCRG